MWSATWPKEVETLAAEVCLNSPVNIHVGDDSLTINNSITQNVICLNEGKKFDELCTILANIGKFSKEKILIFARTKRGCDKMNES